MHPFDHNAEHQHLETKIRICRAPQQLLPILNRHPVPTPKQSGKPGIQRSLDGIEPYVARMLRRRILLILLRPKQLKGQIKHG
ncbi:hypothetical protein, partial [uncultured Akkermansia sp.]|uniref:hypothetical protein n=1 Tax=uncultured Akkermansia sp. TaxID=512294 RepID=UPI00262C2DE2